MGGGDCTFGLRWCAGWWWWTLYGGTSEAEPTFISQLVITRLNGGQTKSAGYCTQPVLYSVCAVLVGYCTRCNLCSVYAVLGVCCIPYMLYLVYSELGVNSWSWYEEIESADFKMGSMIMIEWWTRKHNPKWCWEQSGRCKRSWEISGTTCLIAFRSPCIRGNTYWIGSDPSYVGNGKLTCIWYSVTSQFIMMIWYLLSSLSVSSATLP